MVDVICVVRCFRTCATLALVASVTAAVGVHAGAEGAPATGQPGSGRLADGRTWTTSNLAVDGVTSYCYDDSEANCRRHGRLYPWATAARACQALGAGWRLPSDEEWQRLAQAYGGATADDGRLGAVAYEALMRGGTSGFDAVLGGGRAGDGAYGRGDAHGFYWTATESGPDTAVFYNFGKGSRGLYRQSGGEKVRAFAVRCIRE